MKSPPRPDEKNQPKKDVTSSKSKTESLFICSSSTNTYGLNSKQLHSFFRRQAPKENSVKKEADAGCKKT